MLDAVATAPGALADSGGSGERRPDTGWTTVTGTVLGLPRCSAFRTRNRGVSVATWQVMLALNVA